MLSSVEHEKVVQPWGQLVANSIDKSFSWIDSCNVYFLLFQGCQAPTRAKLASLLSTLGSTVSVFLSAHLLVAPALTLCMLDNFLCLCCTGPHSTVGNLSDCSYVSDCRSRSREFNPGPVPYFRGD